MFPDPQVDLLKLGVNDLIFSSWWVNFPPYITGTQVQEAWSRETGANLLASGIGTSWYNSGSGIYTNGISLENFYNPTGSSQEKLLVGQVPIKNPNEVTISEHGPSFPRSEGLQSSANEFTFETFQAAPGVGGNVSVSQGDLSCWASYRISPSSPSTNETFGVAILNGVYNGILNAEICALLRCPTPTSCTTYAMSTTTIFDRFTITGNFPDASRIYKMVATDQAQIVDNGKYQVSRGTIESTNFGLTLLNSCIFGLVW